MLLTSRWVCNKRMMPTGDHNTPQRALSHRIVPGRPSECKKNQFCSILTFKTVLQSAPEDVIFIKKIEKFSGKGAQPRPLPQREGDTPSSTYPPRRLNPSALQNPRYAIVHVDQFINYCRAQSLHGVPNARTHRPRNVRRM